MPATECQVTESAVRIEKIMSWPLIYILIVSMWLLYIHLAAAKALQSCPTQCNTIDGSPPGSPIPGILQAITLQWVAVSFSNAWKWKVKVKLLSRVRPSATPWTAAFQAPPSMGFSRQEYRSGVPLPSPLHSPWDLTNTQFYFPQSILIYLIDKYLSLCVFIWSNF